MKFENADVMNVHNAIRGIRNSWDSHEKSDSNWKEVGDELPDYQYVIGENDMKLVKKLIKAGSSHAKFMRQILVSVDITAPFYWWKQFDQYKVGTVTNSESTMHRIVAEPFTIEQFQLDEVLFNKDYGGQVVAINTTHILQLHIAELNRLRGHYLETKDKRIWRAIIQLLPDGWLQMRTTTLNFAVLANIYHDRKFHKLDEWKEMCEWIETLPYSELITRKE